jgi:hypothetical protein
MKNIRKKDKNVIEKSKENNLPSRAKDAISKSDGHQVLNHFLSKVVVDTIKLKSGCLQCVGSLI